MNMPTRAFLQNYKISISTLSPVHIGCGEDYEPTNYVMDEQCLHYFDVFGLADVLTEDDRKALDGINKEKSPLLRLQKFFCDRKEQFIPNRRFSRVVAYDLYKKYNNVIGRAANVESDGKQVINALEIARTSYNLHTGLPTIPGTSLKGAIRTALLNNRNAGRSTRLKPKELERDLFQGSFETDPLRLLKVGDANFIENETALYPRIAFENNVKRVPPKGNKPTKQLLCLMREVIPAFSASAFSADLTVQDLLGVKSDKTPSQKLTSMGIAKACNTFYVEIFKRELVRFLQRGCVQVAWAERAKTLLELLSPFIAADAGMLVRVGRHSGAESVTLDGVRSIKIMKGPGKSPGYESQATTDWLVGDQEKSEVNLMPFGWVFVDFNMPELNPAREKLHTFLKDAAKNSLAEQKEFFEKSAQRIASLQEQQQKLMEREATKQREKMEAEQAELAKEAARAAMSPEQQAIEALKDRKAKGEDKGSGPGCKLADDLRLLCEAAAAWDQTQKDMLHGEALEMLVHLGVDKKKNDKWKARLAALKV